MVVNADPRWQAAGGRCVDRRPRWSSLASSLRRSRGRRQWASLANSLRPRRSRSPGGPRPVNADLHWQAACGGVDLVVVVVDPRCRCVDRRQR